jgi:hypothetical protein
MRFLGNLAFELAGTSVEKITSVLEKWRHPKADAREYRAAFWIEWKSNCRVAVVSICLLPSRLWRFPRSGSFVNFGARPSTPYHAKAIHEEAEIIRLAPFAAP